MYFLPSYFLKRTSSICVWPVLDKGISMKRWKSYSTSLKRKQACRLMEPWRGRLAIFKRRSVGLSRRISWDIPRSILDLDDAKSERQRSIYSPCFYSSPCGYKMCSRLFLNGTNTGRETHLSLFFLLMRGEYDAILTWPFRFKVTFSLLDQSPSDHGPQHWSQCFWSDASLKCFQRPLLNFNEAYGIERFISMEQLRNDHQHRYLQNDTAFIKVEVDFQTEHSSKKPLDRVCIEMDNKIVIFLF